MHNSYLALFQGASMTAPLLNCFCRIKTFQFDVVFPAIRRWILRKCVLYKYVPASGCAIDFCRLFGRLSIVHIQNQHIKYSNSTDINDVPTGGNFIVFSTQTPHRSSDSILIQWVYHASQTHINAERLEFCSDEQNY